MTERTVVAARRWIRAQDTLLAAGQRSFHVDEFADVARLVYERAALAAVESGVDRRRA
jgi:hypothetical protein